MCVWGRRDDRKPVKSHEKKHGLSEPADLEMTGVWHNCRASQYRTLGVCDKAFAVSAYRAQLADKKATTHIDPILLMKTEPNCC